MATTDLPPTDERGDERSERIRRNIAPRYLADVVSVEEDLADAQKAQYRAENIVTNGVKAVQKVVSERDEAESALSTAREALRETHDKILEKRTSAQLTTSRSASDCDWDSETYWRARAEGLQEAEKVAAEALDRLGENE